MSKEKTFYEIKDETLADFRRLVSLVEHGVIGYTDFNDSVSVLTNIFLSALRVKRTGGNNNV